MRPLHLQDLASKEFEEWLVLSILRNAFDSFVNWLAAALLNPERRARRRNASPPCNGGCV